MSAKSIALFQQHTAAKTTPPPPMNDPIAELEEQERRWAHRASRALQRALECRAEIERLKGTRQ